MNLVRGKSARVALSAGFAILTSRLLRLLLQGEEYWSFPRMDEPAFAEKLSFLRSKQCRIRIISLGPGRCYYDIKFVLTNQSRVWYHN